MKTRKLLRNLSFWAKRIGCSFLVVAGLFTAIILAGLIPVNRGFEQPGDGVQLFIVSNAVHADIIMPRSNGIVDWSTELGDATFLGSIEGETHIAIGWGDKGFFLETPTWNDFKVSTAVNALFLPSGTCIHASFTKPEYYGDTASVTISEEQYRLLVDFIKQTIKRDESGNLIQIEGYSYGSTDAFFEANGTYHIFNTCNSWVGRGLKAAGVKTPWFSPMPKTPMLYLPENKAR